jgi:hypothetical protein
MGNCMMMNGILNQDKIREAWNPSAPNLLAALARLAANARPLGELKYFRAGAPLEFLRCIQQIRNQGP